MHSSLFTQLLYLYILVPLHNMHAMYLVSADLHLREEGVNER